MSDQGLATPRPHCLLCLPTCLRFRTEPGALFRALRAQRPVCASPPALVVLFVALRRQKQEALMVLEEEDVRENIITYDDEGGGEEDTEAFDISALQNPDGAGPPNPGPPARRDVLPRARAPRQPRPPGPSDVAQLLALRLREADDDPSVPPYDSVQVYGYEGRGSSCGSLSSLGSGSEAGGASGPTEPLDDWGPLFRTLAELYGAKEPPTP